MPCALREPPSPSCSEASTGPAIPAAPSTSGGTGAPARELGYLPVDPLHQELVDFHTYNWTACTTVTCWDTSVLPVAATVPVVTGELGEDDCSASYIDQYMDWADQHDVSYLAWSWEIPSPGNTTCAGTNLQLLSNWNGTPSTTDASGPAVKYHLSHE